MVCYISSLGTSPAGMGMGGWLLCHGRDAVLLFFLLDQLKPLHGMPGQMQAPFIPCPCCSMWPGLILQQEAWVSPICLKIKAEIKHRNVSPGTLDVDL